MFGVKRNRGRDNPYDWNRPLTRVELHVHLDGAVRHETIWELSREKNLPLPGKGTIQELREYLIIKSPKSLGDFLERFELTLDSIRGDTKALERVAYEFVQDSSKQGILYAEARFCPHLLVPKILIQQKEEETEEIKTWVWKATAALIKGLSQGQEDFRTKVNLLATFIRGRPNWWLKQTWELVMDREFHRERIVGIDVAAVSDTASEHFTLDEEVINLYKQARFHGVNRTVHAGETGSSEQVKEILEKLDPHRIGHGYAIVKDNNLMKKFKDDRIHLECCPWSSLLTASVALNEYPHPIVRFFEEEMNVSVNTDDPTVTGTQMDDEFRLLYNWGLCEAHFTRANLNAAKSSFLPISEKRDLVATIKKSLSAV